MQSKDEGYLCQGIYLNIQIALLDPGARESIDLVEEKPSLLGKLFLSPTRVSSKKCTFSVFKTPQFSLFFIGKNEGFIMNI
ncbi:hypothetical protein [Ferdinandcohnia sp. SAFN-114]|uniref:hypothetical protein n=1 Tax=Ferdinandcohnia sp. SAFN-114 TaxID=3387275 RepID=UPI003F808078